MAAATFIGLEETPQMRAALLAQLASLPLFPLHRVYLFPGALIPLYVFEPRYREMTAACLREGGAMAVASLLPGFEARYHDRPPIERIAGAGLVVAHKEHEDGTYHILLQGLSRVYIEEELESGEPFRRARCSLLEDHLARDYDTRTARAALMHITQRLAERLPEGGGALRSLCQEEHDLGRLSDVLSAALVKGPDMRHRLFESAEVALRTELVTAEVASLCQEMLPKGPLQN